MKPSEDLIAAIKSFEGFRAQAYQDAVGVWTIGYGDANAVRPGEIITPAFADLALRAELADKAAAIGAICGVLLNQGQFDALLDFSFNLGINALRESTLLKLLNKSDFTNAAAEFPKWCHAGNKVLPGLLVRRKAEQSWFNGSPVCYPGMDQQRTWLAAA